MQYADLLSPSDQELAKKLNDFVPEEIYDIHTHPYHSDHFAPGAWKLMGGKGPTGCAEHRAALQRYMPAKTIHGLYFGMPHKTADRPAINTWVADQVKEHGTPLSRGLMLVTPSDDREAVASALRSGLFFGIKVYHCYSGREDTMNATVEEYAPDWMWEILHEVSGIMLLHIVRDDAMEDVTNQQSIRRLCQTYLQARLILAHIGRSFNYRNARNGFHNIVDLDNVVVDTSAICESEAFAAAFKILGPRRVLWGSDFAVSEMRGRCVSTGKSFFWLYPEVIHPDYVAPTSTDFTLIGIESLLCLQEACEDAGLTSGDIDDVFQGNALRTLALHLPKETTAPTPTGPELWSRAQSVISCGTGLLSKRAESFDAKGWPSYFSRASGCDVWDLNNNRYVDFAGGCGAILLGYADPDVNAAVRRRVSVGTYSTLLNPQEIELAEQLIDLHPWANKVRYARGGGDAMTVAVRIARAATGKSGIAFCGYHGWHDWYLAANLGGGDALDGHLLPGLEPQGVPRELKGTSVPFHYNNLESLDAAIAQLGDNFAAIVMEPMRSQLPQDDFVAKAAERCRAAGGVFVVDEVTSGLRYGFPGGMSALGIDPDIAVYAKAMSNGIPFGAIIGRDAIMQAADSSFISSSYWTDGIGPAAALAVLEKTQDLSVYETVVERGTRLQASLRELATRHPTCQLAIGGMPATPSMSFDLGDQSRLAQTLYMRKMQARGFLVTGYHYLMLAHDDAKIASLLSAADESMSEVAKVIDAGTLAETTGPLVQHIGFARLT
ncbi:MAG: class III aminotransferase [Opitutaceae bacterium]|nr:class III aminotransferase [Opitutaceae bacterium]